MNLLRKIANYFGLTRSEKNGALVLVVLILLSTSTLLFSQVFFDHSWVPADDEINSKIENFIASQQVIEHEKKSYYASSYPKHYDRPVKKSFDYPIKNYNFVERKKNPVINLNNADTLELQEIKGIGSVFARRIVNYREKLGGFVNKEQLKEIYGMDSLKYEWIKNQISIDVDRVRKININEISLNELKQHPYLDFYQAKEIIKYRSKYGPFKQKSDLRNVNLMDDQSFSKIEKYLAVE